MASPIFISKPPPGFSVVAIIRGFQLAFLGGYRSLQNPTLLNSEYYRQTLVAILISVFLQIVLWAPILLIRFSAAAVGLIFELNRVDAFVAGLKSFQLNVLNISVFMISASRFFSRQLDNLFLSSLQFIDSVAVSKHPEGAPRFHENLLALSEEKPKSVRPTFSSIRAKYANSKDFATFVQRHLFKTACNIGVFALGKVPVVGSLLLGAISFLNLNDKIGTVRACAVFMALQVMPKYYSVLFLTTYWGSRNMVHDLLYPYFSRVRFTKIEKEQWVKSREGLLFGFGLCFFLLIRKFPWVGLLIFGFAESSAAYLITKVSDPPPSQTSQLILWNSSQLVWNKQREHDILSGVFTKTDDGFHAVPGSFIFTPK